MASNNMIPMGMNIDPTAATMNAEVAHNQRLADVMRLHSLQPIQNIGTSPLSQVSPFQALAQVLGAHVANKYDDKAKDAQSAMVQAMQAHTEQGLNQYMEDYKKDPAMAMVNGLKSPSPVVRAFVMQAQKGQVTPRDLAKHATDASVIASNGNPAGFAAKDNLKAIQPGSLLMDDQGQLRTPTTQPGAAPEIVNINGNLFHKTPTGLDPVLKAPQITNNLTNAPQRAGLGSYFTNAAKQVDELGGKAHNSTQMLRTLNELSATDANGINSNLTAPVATFMGNLAQAVGVPMSQEGINKLANTESYKAASTDLWQRMVANVGGNRGITEKESMLVMKALPLAEHSPEARKLIVDTLSRAASRQINDYHTANDAFAKAVQSDDPTIFSNTMKDVYTPNVTDIKVPDNARINQQSNIPQPGKVMTADEYLKQFGK